MHSSTNQLKSVRLHLQRRPPRKSKRPVKGPIRNIEIGLSISTVTTTEEQRYMVYVYLKKKLFCVIGQKGQPNRK